jgi:hypothetical protein
MAPMPKSQFSMRIYQLKGRIKPNRCLAKGANFFEGLQETKCAAQTNVLAMVFLGKLM